MIAISAILLVGVLLGLGMGYRIGQLDERDRYKGIRPALRRLFLAQSWQTTELLRAERNTEALDAASRDVLAAMKQASKALA